MMRTFSESSVIGKRNAGYTITNAVESTAGDLYVTGFSDDYTACTWMAKYENREWCFFWGHYFTDPCTPEGYNVRRATGDMYKRAGYAK